MVVPRCFSSPGLALCATLLWSTAALAQEGEPADASPPAGASPPEATSPPPTETAPPDATPAEAAAPADATPAVPLVEAAATEKPPARPKNVVTVNVPSNIFGAFSLELTRVLTDHVAVFIEPTFFLIGPQEGFSKGVFGPGAVIGTMIHPFGEAPDGLFIAPEFYLTRLDSLGDDFGGDLGLGFGAVGGYSMRFFDHLMASLGLGATANVFGYNLAGERGFGVMPILRANVGAAF